MFFHLRQIGFKSDTADRCIYIYIFKQIVNYTKQINGAKIMLQHIRKISSLAQYPLLTRQSNPLKPLEDHITHARIPKTVLINMYILMNAYM